jgi:hypothetical protein
MGGSLRRAIIAGKCANGSEKCLEFSQRIDYIEIIKRAAMPVGRSTVARASRAEKTLGYRRDTGAA